MKNCCGAFISILCVGHFTVIPESACLPLFSDGKKWLILTSMSIIFPVEIDPVLNISKWQTA